MLFRFSKHFTASSLREALCLAHPKSGTRDPTGRVTIAYPAKLVKNRRVIHDEFPNSVKFCA